MRHFPGQTPFVGRQRELAELCRLIDDGSAVVTLTGPGGVGKTRLALELLSAIGTGDRSSTLVDFAALGANDDIATSLMSALDIVPAGSEDPAAALLAALRKRHAVLVLDNCDPVLPACARVIGALAHECPHVQIIATSREPLGLDAESVFVVAPLSLPASATDSVDELLTSEAATLFVERAQRARPKFELSALNARHVAALCRRLDGLPLAIELAAARVRVLAPHQILDRLDHRFDVLRDERRARSPRHRTLHAAILWSHDLLTPAERALLERISVFAGGAGLDAVEAVCGGDSVESHELVDLLARLTDKSFIETELPDGGDARYRLLETIREFGQERLEASGEAAAVRARHTDWFARLAARAERELWGAEQGVWLRRLSVDHDNLRTAFERCLKDDPVRALDLSANLWRYCELTGRLSDGASWLTRAMAGADAGQQRSLAFARAALGAGYLARDQGRLDGARLLLERSLALFRELGEPKDVGSALRSLGIVAEAEGNHEQARRLFEEALALFRQVAHDLGVGWTLRNLGLLAQARGEEAEAVALFSSALPLLRGLGDRPGVARTLGSLAILARLAGDYAGARAQLEEALSLVRDAGDRRGIAMMLAALGTLAYLEKSPADATARELESLRLSHRAGDTAGIALALAMLGVLALDLRNADVGLTAITVAERCEPRLLRRAARDERAAIEAARARARLALGAEAQNVERRAGSLPLDRAVTLVEHFAAAAPVAAAASSPLGSLTPRQTEVLRLIARGHTNREIATALALSEFTVMRHVSNLFDRLGVSSRAAAAALASRTGLA